MTVTSPIQMRFADVDRLGHVNNVNQQHYLDIGKTDYFRAVLSADADPTREGLITVSTHSDYRAQIRPDEPVTVRTTLSAIGTKSFTLSQQIVNSETGEVKTESHATLVCFDFPAQRSIPIPTAWRAALEAAMPG